MYLCLISSSSLHTSSTVIYTVKPKSILQWATRRREWGEVVCLFPARSFSLLLRLLFLVPVEPMYITGHSPILSSLASLDSTYQISSFHSVFSTSSSILRDTWLRSSPLFMTLKTYTPGVLGRSLLLSSCSSCHLKPWKSVSQEQGLPTGLLLKRFVLCNVMILTN